MRAFIIELWLGHFVISVLGKKILLTRYLLTNAIVYSCAIYLFINMFLVLAIACCIACIYFSYFYFYLFPPRWDELQDVQRWHCGSKVIRDGCYWILDEKELSENIWKWDQLDRYYISLIKI